MNGSCRLPVQVVVNVIFSAMDKSRISYLLYQYAASHASREEVDEMFAWLRSAENDESLQSFILNERTRIDKEINLPQEKWDDMWQAIKSGTIERRSSRVTSMTWFRVAAAAVIVLVFSAIAYLFFGNKKKYPQDIAKTDQHTNDIAPGGNKAILTLADGSTIVLDSMQNGLLAQQGNTHIIKLDEGQLAYRGDKKNSAEIMYNTISTPRGGQYQMVLPDGSKVWLNASSSLHFPASFSSKERRVELTGEAYFEVAPMGSSKKIPFIVHINSSSSYKGMDVQVLGTHFNIMAYADEQNIQTTLLEGKVKVSQDGITRNLDPGKQAVVNHQTHTITVATANVDLAVAWKNGLFRFKETGIRELMRQVERWYNVEVEYQTNRSDQDYTGIVSRKENVSAILKMLEATGTVHFQIEKSKIIVLP